MKWGLLIAGIILMISVLVIPSHATTFQEKTLESDSVKISFGNDVTDYRGIVSPTIESVELKSKIGSILVKDPVFRTVGNSFVIKSFEDNIIIYGINNETIFNFHTLIFVDGDIVRFNDVAKFSMSEIINDVISEEAKKTNNINMLVQNSQFTYNGKDFNFSVKTFDKSKYSGSDFQNFFGEIDGLKITAITKSPDNKIINTQTGFTKYGIYEGTIYIPENLWIRGWYTIEISASGDMGEVQKTIKFYVAGQKPQNEG